MKFKHLIIFIFGIGFCVANNLNSESENSKGIGFSPLANDTNRDEEYDYRYHQTKTEDTLTQDEINLILSHGQVFIDVVANLLDICAVKFDETSNLVQSVLKNDFLKNIDPINKSSEKDNSGDNKSFGNKSVLINKITSKVNSLKKYLTSFLNVFSYGDSSEKEANGIPETNLSKIPWQHFTKLLTTCSAACNVLPSYMEHSLGLYLRNKQLDKDAAVLYSLTHWGDDWTNKINSQMKNFLLYCFPDGECDTFLRIILKLFGKISHGKTVALDSATLQGQQAEEYVREIIWSGIESVIAINPGKEQWTTNDDDEEDYWIASNINYKNNPLIKSSNTLERNALLSYIINLIRYPSHDLNNQYILQGVIEEIQFDRAQNEVPHHFLSIALESAIMGDKWKHFNTKSKRLQTLVKGLAPTILRIGGTSANFLTYEPVHEDETDKVDFQQLFGRIKNTHPKFKRQAIYNENTLGGSTKQKILSIPKSHPKYHTIKKIHKPDPEDADFVRKSYRVPRNAVFDPSETKYIEDLNRANVLTKPSHSVKFKNFTMEGKHWDALLEFADDLDLTLMFDLNQFHRDPSTWSWDSTNAEKLFSDTKSKYPNAKIIWQLGNEPNAYKHNFDFEITPEQAASDYHTLKEALSRNFPDNSYTRVVGPDVTRPRHKAAFNAWIKKSKKGNGGWMKYNIKDRKLDEDSMEYLKSFLDGAKNEIDVVSWHQYYISGKTADIDDFTSPDIMDELVHQIQEVLNITAMHAQGKQVWLTETSSAYGGGAPDLSDSFVAGFLWLSKLGDAAANGISVVTRQALIGSSYGLLDQDYYPLPDYWLSLIHKNLVGEKVLKIQASGTPRTVRMYAHCLKSDSELYNKGAIVIFGLNTESSDVVLQLPEHFKNLKLFKFDLQPLGGDLTSREVTLNGRLLVMPTDDSLPKLIPREVKKGELHFHRTSLAFWVVPDALADVC